MLLCVLTTNKANQSEAELGVFQRSEGYIRTCWSALVQGSSENVVWSFIYMGILSELIHMFTDIFKMIFSSPGFKNIPTHTNSI